MESDVQKKMEMVEKVKAWREALREAADLTGMVLADGHEAKFIQEVVSVIEMKLGRNAMYVEEHLVGINVRVDGINSWLQDGAVNEDILFIYGIGGIGKTTIAKCIYNSNFGYFEGCCFLADIGVNSNQPRGLLDLQIQLVSTIRKRLKEETIWNVHEGTMKIKDAICNKRVLIVLDDVTEKSQLDVLLGPKNFSRGSKIIITTRYKALQNSFKGCCKDHKVKELDQFESMELFSWFAFQQDHPREDYLMQSRAIVQHCGGHPLALKVLGSSLLGSNVDVWEDTLRKLTAVLDGEIYKFLEISYETLQDDTIKDIFLHIACFFVGEDKDYVINILEQCDLYSMAGIQNLIDRCLLVVEGKKLMMHQLIQQMGREIVRRESPKEPGKRSRLWRSEDSFSVLKENMGTEKVEGLILRMWEIKRPIKDLSIQSANTFDDTKRSWYEKIIRRSYVANWLTSSNYGNDGDLKIDAFETMGNLMFLQLNYVTLTGSYQKLPKKLRWLCWHGFPSNFISIDIHLDKLVVLDMRHSKLQQVWKGLKFLGLLKVLNLSYSKELIRTPDFRGLPSLESLILKGCVSLVEVCTSIVDLKGLVLLDLEGCKSLRNSPGLPSSLITLKMSGCTNLGDVRQFKWSSSLPPALVTLGIEGCNLSDDSFPKDLSSLFSLECLVLSKNFISALPDCFKSLPRLKKLHINLCPQLQSVLNVSSTVQHLEIGETDILEEVIAPPNSLTYFDYRWSRKLVVVEGCFKYIPVEKVDRNIINNLGLESILVEEDIDGRQKLSTEKGFIKVLYEFGIFSTYIPWKRLPSSFMYKERGSTISFRAPSFPNNRKIQGLNACFISSSAAGDTNFWMGVVVQVFNMTKGLGWIYVPTPFDFPTSDYVWLSLWKCINILDCGDGIHIRIIVRDAVPHCQPEEFCVDLVFEDKIFEEDRNVETEDISWHKRSYKHLSWTDKLFVQLPNYNQCGKIYYFTTYLEGLYNNPGSVNENIEVLLFLLFLIFNLKVFESNTSIELDIGRDTTRGLVGTEGRYKFQRNYRKSIMGVEKGN